MFLTPGCKGHSHPGVRYAETRVSETLGYYVF